MIFSSTVMRGSRSSMRCSIGTLGSRYFGWSAPWEKQGSEKAMRQGRARGEYFMETGMALEVSGVDDSK